MAIYGCSGLEGVAIARNRAGVGLARREHKQPERSREGNRDSLESDTALPYITLHSVIETNAYLAAADDAGMSEDARVDVVNLLAADPQAGAIMPGCGGARKLRARRPGGGKSGGWRVITYHGGDDIPVFLLTVFAKGEKDNLTGAERNGLAALTKRLRDSLTSRGRA